MTRLPIPIATPLTNLVNAAVLAGLVAIAATAPQGAQAGARNEAVADIAIPGLFPARDRAALIATTQSPAASLKDKAIAWHGLAGQREKDAAYSTIELLESAPEATRDPLMKAYLGSAYIMKARDQSFVPARVRSVRKGISILQDAVAAAPASFEVRSLRAATTMNLPDIFDYRDEVRGDLGTLIGMIESGAAPVPAGSETHGRFILALAKACAQDADTACAQRQLQTLQAGFGGNPNLSAPAAALAAAMGQ